MLRIVQLTDIHIDTPDKPYYDIDVKGKFLSALEKISTYPDIDLLIISGDLAAHEGEIESYQWIEQQLKYVTVPYIVMAGNHDNMQNMQQVFDIDENHLHDGMLYFRQEVKGFPLLFLDTANYFLPQIQLDWLKKQPHVPSFLFMHHPPTFCNCIYMDNKYPLQNRDEVWPQLVQLPHIEHIFCGHYHTARSIFKDQKAIHIAPSTMLQIAACTKGFGAANHHPGWRVIEWDGKQLNTFVEYASLTV
ncbi:metallophosphoesterase [Candidatus Albibeggiatoa sp. nov. NOAA]|uniref:metallophosphoesterase n=1 Tax=Candidatus Albibeggiatoa sp. nov. NOAA TaxID=3162724 RepID=UPI0033042BB7|nr:metallophosphoesterase [Thiotrichaceae bacterium]